MRTFLGHILIVRKKRKVVGFFLLRSCTNIDTIRCYKNVLDTLHLTKMYSILLYTHNLTYLEPRIKHFCKKKTYFRRWIVLSFFAVGNVVVAAAVVAVPMGVNLFDVYAPHQYQLTK